MSLPDRAVTILIGYLISTRLSTITTLRVNSPDRATLRAHKHPRATLLGAGMVGAQRSASIDSAGVSGGGGEVVAGIDVA
jgi:hypothetical protein